MYLIDYIKKIYNIYFFKKFSKKKFFKKKSKHDNIILVEQFNYHPSLIPSQYFANILSERENAEIVLYENLYKNIFFYKVLYFLRDLLPYSYRNIYRSFGAKKKFFTDYSGSIIARANKIYSKEFHKLKSKEDVLKLKLEGVEIGELLYDFYLANYNKPTIDIYDNSFKTAMQQFFRLFYYWDLYFKKNEKKVKAMIVSHDVYHYAIPLRIAINLDIPCYTVGHGQCFYLNKENLRKKTRFNKYKEDFNKLSNEIKSKGIKESKKILEKKFSGELTFDKANNAPIDVNLFEKSNSQIRLSNKKKILVATHCFTDAIHAYGETLFTDYYDWIDFIGKKTIDSEYEWLLKAHPAQYEKNLDHLKYFEKKYENFLLLPKKISHFELINNDVIGVLTMYGSIGYEYPYFGIPVINASNYNPHNAFNFNYCPKTINEYNKLIDNIQNLKFDKEIYRSEIYEYYFCNFLKDYYLFDDHIKIVEELGKNYSSPLVYQKWIENFSTQKHNDIIKKIDRFIESKVHRFLKDNH